LVGAWVTDAMAYFTGRFLGKHKLAPDVSPKKTIEGSIGGTVFCAIAFVLMGLVVKALVKDSSPNYIYLAISGLVIAVVSQAGDLIMSVIKRHYNIKDFGNLFPGHGGMLDRMDSVFSVALGMQAIIMITHLTGISLF
jgi:phosphatidate cytidylyltransferase